MCSSSIYAPKHIMHQCHGWVVWSYQYTYHVCYIDLSLVAVTCLHIHVFHTKYLKFGSSFIFIWQMKFLGDLVKASCMGLSSNLCCLFSRRWFPPFTRLHSFRAEHLQSEGDMLHGSKMHLYFVLLVEINQIQASQGWNVRAVLSVLIWSIMLRQKW